MADEEPDLEGRLRLSAPTATTVTVEFQPSVEAWRYARPAHKGDPPWKPIAKFDTSSDLIKIIPRRAGPSFSVLGHRYAPLTEIAFEGFQASLPASPDNVEAALGVLPNGFYTQPTRGLGVRSQVRPLINVLARRRIVHLLISRTRQTSINGDELILSLQDFDEIAYELVRIAKRFSDQSRVERSRHAYNEVLAKRFPERFAPDGTPYGKGVIVSFLRRARRTAAELSPEDRRALVDEASRHRPGRGRVSGRTFQAVERFDRRRGAGH